jgi:hypothetical protein
MIINTLGFSPLFIAKAVQCTRGPKKICQLCKRRRHALVAFECWFLEDERTSRQNLSYAIHMGTTEYIYVIKHGRDAMM